jgi:tetratricopeptide (TPR) repeat protein
MARALPGLVFIVLAQPVLVLGSAALRPTVRVVQEQPVAISVLFERYRGGEFDAVSDELARTMDWKSTVKDLDRNFKSWPVVPAAVFALEAIVAQSETYREPGVITDTLELACKRIRESGLSAQFVRDWNLAALALLQSVNQDWPVAGATRQVGAQNQHVDHVLELVPSDPRIRLSATLMQEQKLHVWLSRAGVEILNPRAKSSLALLARNNHRALLKDLGSRYEALRAEPQVRDEATIRLAFVRRLQGQHEEAIRLLNEGEAATEDSWLKFIARLFRGQTLTSLGRTSEAILAFRDAVRVNPLAQSAQLSLASMLYLQGERTEASQLVGNLLRSATTEDDPWFWYAYGDYRHWPRYRATLREALR